MKTLWSALHTTRCCWCFGLDNFKSNLWIRPLLTRILLFFFTESLCIEPRVKQALYCSATPLGLLSSFDADPLQCSEDNARGEKLALVWCGLSRPLRKMSNEVLCGRLDTTGRCNLPLTFFLVFFFSFFSFFLKKIFLAWAPCVMEDDSNSWPSYLYLPNAEITPKFQLTEEENFYESMHWCSR